MVFCRLDASTAVLEERIRRRRPLAATGRAARKRALQAQMFIQALSPRLNTPNDPHLRSPAQLGGPDERLTDQHGRRRRRVLEGDLRQHGTCVGVIYAHWATWTSWLVFAGGVTRPIAPLRSPPPHPAYTGRLEGWDQTYDENRDAAHFAHLLARSGSRRR